MARSLVTVRAVAETLHLAAARAFDERQIAEPLADLWSWLEVNR